MVRIAVTGGIGCGKSRLALYLQSCHIPICEADEIAHKALARGSKVYENIVKEFGTEILDISGEINRNKLAGIVFENVTKLKVLNGLVHPFVKSEIFSWLESFEKSSENIVAAVIPLLFEAGMQNGWDAIISVGCSSLIQNERLLERGLSKSQCRQRIMAQMPIDEKMARSDFVIWNNDDVKSFEKKIDDVLKTIRESKYGRRE